MVTRRNKRRSPGGKIRARVQRAAVVPHQDVGRAPDMLVDELRLLLVIKELLQIASLSSRGRPSIARVIRRLT
jgi:hypothetical protein